jgi:uncharacterized protein DUF1569
MKTLLDPAWYERVLSRVRALRPETPARWGRMTAPQMLAHLCDQMRYTLGEYRVTLHRGPLRWPPVKHAIMFWLPWPKGRIKGSPEMFLTPPVTWSADLVTFQSLLDRFVAKSSATVWPEHPFFGTMTRESWARFSYRHFDHHLRQFGA